MSSRPALGSSAARISGCPRASRWLLIYLPLRSMSAGPGLHGPLPSAPAANRAFDSGPAANGFVTEALQPLHRRAPHGSVTPGSAKGPSSWHGNSGVNQRQSLRCRQCCRLRGLWAPHRDPSHRGLYGGLCSGAPSQSSLCPPPGSELSEWKGNRGQGSGGAA